MTEYEKNRLQASLDYWNLKAILDDQNYRATIRAELSERTILNRLRAWAGDYSGGFTDEL